MPEQHTESRGDMARLFEEYERPLRVQNAKICCVAAGIFMPAGAFLDHMVYGDAKMREFLPLRFACTALLAVLWLVLNRTKPHQGYRFAGHIVILLPIVFIAWMIHATEGASSSYYAGLNLVNLGAVILLRWTLWDSVLIFFFTLAAYLAATLLHGPVRDGGVYFNNLYFLVVTGVFIIMGSWLYNNIRRSEFEARHHLDQSRRDLEASNQKLRELDEAKSRFFANVSHELRTPLTLLIAPVEAMLSRGDAMPEGERRELLSTMHDNSLRLLKLINHLLDLVRLETGTAQVSERPVDLAAFVKGLCNSVETVAKDKRVRLECHADPGPSHLMLDPEKLERVCLNLLFNALKFTPAGGAVAMRLKRLEGRLEIEVSDTGIGIPEDQMPHIFNRFWQADTSAKRKFQGMGIGLALVKELTEAMGGEVTASSAPGKGTVMTVCLPAKPAEAPAAGEEEKTAEREWIASLYRRAEQFSAMPALRAALRPVETSVRPGSSRPVLLVADDEPDMLRFLKSQLASEYEVLEAADGHEAVEKAAQFMPDAILCDMMMPEKDGLQVCRDLRDRATTRSIPIVLVTARACEETKLDGLAAGASDFLPKPFSMAEVRVRLKNLVDSRAFQRELVVQKQRLEAALEQLKEAETVLVHNEKLASLGRLSAGLIHEINNPLNYARQGLLLLERNAPSLPESEREDYLDTLKDVREGVDRVVRIVSDLRGFTRKDSRRQGAFDLATVVEAGMRFFAHERKNDILFEIEVPPGLEARGDSNQFLQMLINLVQNSLDSLAATDRGGEQPARIRVSARRDAGWIRFSVWDNGHGIPEEVRGQIFDPFFTTRDVGAGMGLGLAICGRIVADMGGRIEVASEPGRFAEIILILPAAEDAPV